MPKVTELRAPAPASTTLGACRARLIENGYRPVSALAPFGFTLPARPPVVETLPDWVTSEHPAAVLCIGGAQRNVIAMSLTWPEDATLAARVRDLLKDRGLLSGPCRTGSNGLELRPLRLGAYDPMLGRGATGIEFFCAIAPGISHVIPLDGSWSAGTLLEVPYASLPVISGEEIEDLLKRVQKLPWQLSIEREPPPKPAKAGWIGRG